MFLPDSSLLQAAPVVRDPGALLDDVVDDRVVLSVLAGVSRSFRAPLDSPGSSGLLWRSVLLPGAALSSGRLLSLTQHNPSLHLETFKDKFNTYHSSECTD